MSWHVIFFNLLLIVCCSYALLRGGPPERIVGGSLITAAFATILSYSPLAARFQALEPGLLVVDVVLLAVLMAIGLNADRGWPIALAGLQLDTVGAHLVRAFGDNVVTATYAVMLSAWSYPMVVLLAIGTMRHQQRLRRQNYDLSWSFEE